MNEVPQNGQLLRTLQATPEQQAAFAGMLAGMGLPVSGMATGEKVVSVFFLVGPGSPPAEPAAQEPGMIKELISEMKAVRKELRESRDFPPEPVSEDLARQAFALVKALDGDQGLREAPVFTVFRLYCMEGLSAQKVADKCHCSKATIINRLRMIARKTGRKPDQLRAYSAQFEQIETSLADPRARRIRQKNAIDEDRWEGSDD